MPTNQQQRQQELDAIKEQLYLNGPIDWPCFHNEAFTRGSIHCHGFAKLSNDPGLCDLKQTSLKGFLAQKYKDEHKDENTSDLDYDIIAGQNTEELACKHVDWLPSAVIPNPADEDMCVRHDCHPCQKRYQDLPDCDIHDDFLLFAQHG